MDSAPDPCAVPSAWISICRPITVVNLHLGETQHVARSRRLAAGMRTGVTRAAVSEAVPRWTLGSHRCLGFCSSRF